MLAACVPQSVQPETVSTEKPPIKAVTPTEVSTQGLPKNWVPKTPSNPAITNRIVGKSLNVTLSWNDSGTDRDAVTYTIYLEANNHNPSTVVSTNQSGTSYTATNLANDTTYYWKIVVKNASGASAFGPIWNFTTGDSSSSKAILIAAGLYHTCALTSVGGVKCWGWNGEGELGNGTLASRRTPENVVGLSSGIISIAAGGFHTCALTSNGGVKCWGDNSFGELGNGDTDSDPHPLPVNVVGLSSGVVAISAGDYHSCALTDSGEVKCWGDNAYGQLGDGSNTENDTPVDVVALSSGVVAIAAGYEQTCAITSNGKVKCWGENGSGQLGDGTTTNRSTPVNVVGLPSKVTAIAAGYEHICGLTIDGAVKCWGNNMDGELGDGTNIQRLTPMNVVGLSSEITSIAAGGYHTCALTRGGGIKCWGWNRSGQLGVGTTTDNETPLDVNLLSSGVIAMVAGHYHTCALISGGRLKCWGKNDSGQLGDGTNIDNWTPANVVGFP